MPIKSRLPKIAASLPIRAEAVAKAAAEDIASRARDLVPVGHTGKLRASIHVERDDLGDYLVVAGDERAFYGMLVEHGTVHQPARPFLVPASEEARPGIQAIGAAALKGL